jgi:8-hydroxy-5-deazaflavin:NADPH oxidoreductase
MPFMKICIIGSGNVGSALAAGFKKAGHEVTFGVRDINAFKGKANAEAHQIGVALQADAVKNAEVIVLATPAQLAHEVAASLGDVADKIIIDTMNAVFAKPAHYSNASDAILDNCNCKDVVKCFNSTGAENMANPVYHGEGIDMFMAGDSVKGKQIASQLAKDIGFAEVYDCGGNDKFSLLEQMAMAWINLAIMQKQGRDIAFKLIKR